MTERLQREKEDDPGEDDDDWQVYDLELAQTVYGWLDATEWRWPPDVLLRQPAALMHDLATIVWLKRLIKIDLSP